MESLRQLLARHAPLLLIDTCSQVVHAGLAREAGTPIHWQTCEEEAGSGLFRAVEAVLAAEGQKIADMRGFVFCEGPGSVLGIRTAAVALRTWHVLNDAPMFAFQGLDVVARFLNRPEVSIIADARRDTWHVARLGQAITRVPSAELSDELAMPAGFRHWSKLPATAARVPYDLGAMLAAIDDQPVFRPVDAPDAFLHETPAYATWSPQVHQAPAPRA
ncbi:MAG: peptidase M22 [Verrucomicrobiota bacterium]